MTLGKLDTAAPAATFVPHAPARTGTRPKILAISSGGGHWVQLQAIVRNLEGDLVFATTSVPAGGVAGRVRLLPDANKDHPLKLLQALLRVVLLLIEVRPSHVITTGAAPGCLAVVLMHLAGRPAVFVDSIANAERLSLSGRIASRFGVLTLTQWPHLVDRDGVQYSGNVFGELA